jgi:hypothetical protein
MKVIAGRAETATEAMVEVSQAMTSMVVVVVKVMMDMAVVVIMMKEAVVVITIREENRYSQM